MSKITIEVSTPADVSDLITAGTEILVQALTGGPSPQPTNAGAPMHDLYLFLHTLGRCLSLSHVLIPKKKPALNISERRPKIVQKQAKNRPKVGPKAREGQDEDTRPSGGLEHPNPPDPDVYPH